MKNNKVFGDLGKAVRKQNFKIQKS